MGFFTNAAALSGRVYFCGSTLLKLPRNRRGNAIYKGKESEEDPLPGSMIAGGEQLAEIALLLYPFLHPISPLDVPT